MTQRTERIIYDLPQIEHLSDSRIQRYLKRLAEEIEARQDNRSKREWFRRSVQVVLSLAVIALLVYVNFVR